MKKIVSILIALVFAVVYLTPVSASGSPYAVTIPVGEEAVSPMKKGQKAPFDGVLYSTAAAAKVQIQLENADNQCKVEKDHELEKQKAKHDLELANERAAKEAAAKRVAELTALKNDQIEFLTKEIERSQKKNSRNWGPLYLAGGVLGGILITIAAGYALGQIDRQ